MYMKKFFILLSLCALLVPCCKNRGGKADAEAEAAAREQAVADSITKAQTLMDKLAQLPEEPVFDIVTSMGTIKIKLYAKTPKHRDNFAKLALSGFYDGLLFHRVIDGFMIQGGDPDSKGAPAGQHLGAGGPGYTVPAEFVPEYTHIKGAVAAARRGDAANPLRESSGSQFYIVQNPATCAQLDGEYTVFGETIEGLNVIDRIARVEKDRADRPLVDIIIKKVKLDESCLVKAE